MTLIEAKKDLYNGGKCFTKGKRYEVNRYVEELYQLMNVQVTNDQGQPHSIGIWYKDFKIVS
jgi:cellulase/cellobiase CelA1